MHRTRAVLYYCGDNSVNVNSNIILASKVFTFKVIKFCFSDYHLIKSPKMAISCSWTLYYLISYSVTEFFFQGKAGSGNNK